MPVALRVRVQSVAWLVEGRCPRLVQLMGLLPVVALPDLDVVADLPAALDLWRTHPLSVQATWKLFAIEKRTRSLDADAPDAWTDVIAGSPIGGILRSSYSQLDADACLQVPREVGVFVQVSLLLFHPRQWSYPDQVSRTLR